MARKYWAGGMEGAGGKQGDFGTGLLINATLKTAGVAINLTGYPNRVRFETTAAHGIIENDYVVVRNTSYYDGEYIVKNVSDTTHFDIESNYTAETFDASETVLGSNWFDDDKICCAIPEAGDEIVFSNSYVRIAEGFLTRHTKGKPYNLVDGIARANTGGLAFANIIVEDGYLGNIGVDAENTISDFHLSIIALGVLSFGGSGRAYFKCSDDEVNVSSAIPTLILNTSSGYIRISSDENDGTYKSEWEVIKCLNGGVLNIADNTVVGDIYTYDNPVAIEIGENCVDASDSDSPIKLHIGNEEIYSSREISTRIETSGILTLSASSVKITNT